MHSFPSQASWPHGGQRSFPTLDFGLSYVTCLANEVLGNVSQAET